MYMTMETMMSLENEISNLYLFLNRYTAENLMKYGAPKDTAHPELRQPLAFEVWQQVIAELGPTDKITVLTNGPLTNIANIILSDTKEKSMIEVSKLVSKARELYYYSFPVLLFEELQVFYGLYFLLGTANLYSRRSFG